MKEIKIDKKVALPEKAARSQQFYPFEKMKVGDSFLIESFENAHRVRSAISARQQRKDDNKEFTVKKVGEGMFRCWRLK